MSLDYRTLAVLARKKVLAMVHKAKTSHIASNFSVIDIAVVVYNNLTPNDEVIWSKGWAAATIYYCLAEQGIIPKEDLEKFPNEPYLGLAETAVKGVWVSSGSMGHGLPVAVGMAIGKKRAKEKGVMYCIMSDGELNEGTTWESAMVAYHHKLDNVVLFVDANRWQAMGTTKEVLDIEPIEQRWAGFGWNTLRVNGHNHQELHDAVMKTREPSNDARPWVIICDTIKGKGVSFFEDHLLYHYKEVNEEEYARALAELV